MRVPLNCWLFAVWLWLTRGGYLIARRSRSGPFPHYMWAPRIPADLPVVQFLPHRRRQRLLPPPLFFGQVSNVAEPEGALPARDTGIDWPFLGFFVCGVGAVLAIVWQVRGASCL